MSWVVVKGTGRAEYGNYKPVDQTSSGRNTKRPQWYDFQLLTIVTKDYKIYLKISLEAEFCLFVELFLPFSLIFIISVTG